MHTILYIVHFKQLQQKDWRSNIMKKAEYYLKHTNTTFTRAVAALLWGEEKQEEERTRMHCYDFLRYIKKQHSCTVQLWVFFHFDSITSFQFVFSHSVSKRKSWNVIQGPLYHFDSVFLIAVTVFPTHFPHRNLEKRHYETNTVSFPTLLPLKIVGKTHH